MNEHDIKKAEDCLEKYPIIIAYLFGSEAKGSSGLQSDIDIAVYVSDKIDKPERFDLRLKLSNELSYLLSRRIDLVVLNDSPAQLAYEIIKHGRMILCRDRFMTHYALRTRNFLFRGQNSRIRFMCQCRFCLWYIEGGYTTY